MKRSVEIILACTLLLLAGLALSKNREALPLAQAQEDGAGALDRDLEFSDGRCLRLEIQEEAGEESSLTLKAQPGIRGREELHYVDISQALVEVDWKTYDLEEALEEGLVSLEELFGQAQLDAYEEICRSYVRKVKGCTLTVFAYPEYQLWFSGSREMGDHGKWNFTAQLYLCPPRELAVESPKDWGLTFEVLEVTSTSLTLSCTHAGGDTLGALQVKSFPMVTEAGEELKYLDSQANHDLALPIQREETTQLTLDWSKAYGPLPAGKYSIHLNVEELTPGLPFGDQEVFSIPITIPGL